MTPLPANPITNVTVTFADGSQYDAAGQFEGYINDETPTEVIPCPDDPPCNAAHRRPTGERRLTVRVWAAT